MMKMLLALLFVSAAFAETSSEEAIILNQEMQFLENSARDLEVIRPQVSARDDAEEKSPEDLNLERTYFSDSERDEIRTRAAAPRRMRSF